MEFGKLVKLKRKQKKITLNELANYTDISISYLSRLENNERTPVITIALTLAKYLDISLEEIEDAYGIKLKERKEEKTQENILANVDDYIVIDEIKNILIELAQGKVEFSNAILQVSNKMKLLEKELISVIAKFDECTLIILVKFYDEKIIRFLRNYLIEITKDIMIIKGEVKESELCTETYDLMDYLDIIEYSYQPDSCEMEYLEEIREYLKKINY